MSPFCISFIFAIFPYGPTDLFVIKKLYKNSTPVQDGDFLFPSI